MANSAQSLKRARQAGKRQQANKSLRTRFRAVVRRARASALASNPAAAEDFNVMQSVADRAARKGIVHRRAVARLKSRIAAAAKKAKNSPAEAKAAPAKTAAKKSAPAKAAAQAEATAAEAQTAATTAEADQAAPKAAEADQAAPADAPETTKSD